MTQRWFIGLGLLLAACGGTAATSPAPSAKETVRQFMQAAADSNLAKMAMLWGTAKGPAAETGEPEDYERRIVVIQAYLRGADFRIGSEYPGEVEGQRLVQVDVVRGDCSSSMPVTTIRTDGERWLVYRFDLTAAGTPTGGCPGEEPASP